MPEKDFFVIVHREGAIQDWEKCQETGDQNHLIGPPERYPGVISEISRIMAEEAHFVITGELPAGYSEFDIPEGSRVKVCGAYYGWACVNAQMEVLSERGISSTLHPAGTIVTKPYLDEAGLA